MLKTVMRKQMKGMCLRTLSFILTSEIGSEALIWCEKKNDQEDGPRPDLKLLHFLKR